jgi:flagellar hook protein FlgE
MSIGFSASLEGLSRAEGLLNTTATQIARDPFPSSTAQPGDTVSLSDQMVALLQARTDFEANTKALQTADEMTQNLLNIFG